MPSSRHFDGLRLPGGVDTRKVIHTLAVTARQRYGFPMISIEPVRGLPEIRPGDDLGAMLSDALVRIEQPLAKGDVLVVTQKIVSKAEGRFVRLADVKPGAEACALSEVVLKDPRLVELVLRESSAVVRAAPNVLITRHRLGLVMANAGIDASNLGPGREGSVLLLPEAPDASAQRIAAAVNGAVVISDSFSRPWRVGVVNVAIGAAGLPSIIDRRGELDRDGRALQVTQVALADLLASAAGLVAGEGAEGVPAAVLRGCAFPDADIAASALVRSAREDLFR